MKKIDSQDKKNIEKIMKELPDIYSDFYITKSNLRLAVKENLNIVLNDVVNGDRIFYADNCILLICGEADKSDRCYVKFLTKTKDDLELMLNVAFDEYKKPLYAKLKKENEHVVTLINKGFKIYKNRGKEILLLKDGE